MKFQLLIKIQMLNRRLFTDVAFIMLTDVKMPPIDDILTFMSMVLAMKKLYSLGPDLLTLILRLI